MHMHVYQNEGADAAEHERRVREGYLAFPHAFWSRLPWKERDKKKRMLKPNRTSLIPLVFVWTVHQKKLVSLV